MKKFKLCVFPGDSLKALYEKGEVKARYYNPKNVFGEVHFITFCEKDVEPEKVKAIVGNARIFIHPLGKLKPWSLWTKRKLVLEKVKSISPDVIRAYTPSVHGFLASYCARKLSVPFVLSLHINPEMDLRRLAWDRGDYKNWLKSAFLGLLAERRAVSSADEIICVYDFSVPYARKHGGKNITVIYNKVYAKNFSKAKPALKLKEPGIISVGRLIAEKNPEPLIRALKILSQKRVDARLVLVGDGPLKKRLVSLTESLGVSDKVTFLPSVANSKLPGYYKSCKIFAQSLEYGGISIPIIEAMAAGLPVVVSKAPYDPEREISGEVGLIVDNTPQAFASAIQRLLEDGKLYSRLKAKGLKKFKEIEGSKMEAREARIYSGYLR
ncbi:MAG: glycosyltransferase family 4 protein [Candidatus Norongarragalinales archaeon]